MGNIINKYNNNKIIKQTSNNHYENKILEQEFNNSNSEELPILHKTKNKCSKCSNYIYTKKNYGLCYIHYLQIDKELQKQHEIKIQNTKEQEFNNSNSEELPILHKKKNKCSKCSNYIYTKKNYGLCYIHCLQIDKELQKQHEIKIQNTKEQNKLKKEQNKRKKEEYENSSQFLIDKHIEIKKEIKKELNKIKDMNNINAEIIKQQLDDIRIQNIYNGYF
jgi:hypothetical protein